MNKETKTIQDSPLDSILKTPFNPFIKWGLIIVFAFLSSTMYWCLSREVLLESTICSYKYNVRVSGNEKIVTMYTYQKLPKWIYEEKIIDLISTDYSIIKKVEVLSVSSKNNISVIMIKTNNQHIIDKDYCIILKKKSCFSIICKIIKDSIIRE